MSCPNAFASAPNFAPRYLIAVLGRAAFNSRLGQGTSIGKPRASHYATKVRSTQAISE